MDLIHHILDVYPEPREKAARFINETWLIDKTVKIVPNRRTPQEGDPDNIRIYVPLNLNRRAILRRLDEIISLEFIGRLETIRDGGAEKFHSCMISELRENS